MIGDLKRDLASDMALIKYQGAFGVDRLLTPVEATAHIKKMADGHVMRAVYVGMGLGMLPLLVLVAIGFVVSFFP